MIWAEDGKHELYDLKNDRSESNNIIDLPEYVSFRQDLMLRLRDFRSKYYVEMKGKSTTPGDNLDKETIKALRSLGYLQ